MSLESGIAFSKSSCMFWNLAISIFSCCVCPEELPAFSSTKLVFSCTITSPTGLGLGVLGTNSVTLLIVSITL